MAVCVHQHVALIILAEGGTDGGTQIVRCGLYL